ncbi:MAG: hypothetical protein K2N51_18245 [Lachnospiraceae bacterium]|nr:hypothetical protein [Lachnospiraceae bacterium]
MQKLFQKEKGEYGYITKSKKYDIIKMLIYVGIALVIFVVGLLLNKMSYVNVFTIVAILFVLPWARVLVEYILLFPYHTPDQKDYEKWKAAVPEGSRLLSDIIITSTEKSMGLDFMILGCGYVFGLATKEKQDNQYVQNYLKKGVEQNSNAYQVKIFQKEKDFENALKNAKVKEISVEERESVEKYLLSIMV